MGSSESSLGAYEKRLSEFSVRGGFFPCSFGGIKGQLGVGYSESGSGDMLFDISDYFFPCVDVIQCVEELVSGSDLFGLNSLVVVYERRCRSRFDSTNINNIGG